MSEQSFVIIGGGFAAAKAAETLRAEDFTGRVTIIGAETHTPYERPPLSKGYLLGKDQLDVVYPHDDAWYRAHDVGLRLGHAVERLDPSSHQLTLSGGDTLSFDKALLVTGSRPRHLDLPGTDLDGVLYLRTIDDSERLRSVLGDGVQVVVIGAGWIGLEVAAAARSYGATVTIVEPQEVPLSNVMGSRMGDYFAALHRENGVELRLGTTVDHLDGEDGRVTGVVTGDGATIPASVVIVGVGVVPNVELAERAGLKVDNGVVTDEWLRTSHPDIYAAGDVARSFRPFYGSHVRVEHWGNALETGPAAARNMLGRQVPFEQIPYFFTDQYDLGMEYVGWFPPGGFHKVVIRGAVEEKKFHAFWLDHDRVVAGMHVNLWDEGIDPVRDLIRGRAIVSPVKLADPGIPLAEATAD
ncbi:NAD(P)/FAD-dependent oxidoreductase [Stackebrandtia soli]|uniref:NAD(P)/FAD-dependent oxidoreductase n=1 Tax=Stackebrandtia soli TaxID=1892856 RepID=UPI0039E8252A